MDKKVFFFDVDGTLLYNQKITDRVREAVRKTRENGDLCFVASGRPPAFISDYVKSIGFDGFVLANGATIVYNDRIINEEILNYNHLKALIDFLEEENVEYILQTSTKCYLRKEYMKLYEFFETCSVNFNEVEADYDKEEQLRRTLKIEVWPTSEKNRQDIIDRLNHFKYQNYENKNIEIYSDVVNKATGIKKLVDYLGISFENTYCFGDGVNDLEMFKSVSHSYAMGNATLDVQAKAKYVCPSVEKDGVAVILEKLLKKEELI